MSVGLCMLILRIETVGIVSNIGTIHFLKCCQYVIKYCLYLNCVYLHETE